MSTIDLSSFTTDIPPNSTHILLALRPTIPIPVINGADDVDVSNLQQNGILVWQTADEKWHIQNINDAYIAQAVSLHSAGVTGPVPSFNNTGLDFTVGSFSCYLFDNDEYRNALNKFDIPETTVTLTDNTMNYVYVDYNNGTPILTTTTNINLINESNRIPITTILTTNGYIHSAHWNSLGDGLSNKIHMRLVKTRRYEKESGLRLGCNSGVGTIEEGIVWKGARRFFLQNTYSDGTNNSDWFFYYHSAGDFIYEYNKPFDNLHYDNGTNLIELTNDQRYTINWIYRGVEDHQHGYTILGNKEYKDLPTAIAETIIPSPPVNISQHAILVGRMIIQKGSTVPYVEQYYEDKFTGTVINEHNELSGIQGGTTGEYYHLRDGYYITDTDELWVDVQVPLIGRRLDSPVGSINYNYTDSGLNFGPNGNINSINDLVIMPVQLPHETKLDSIAKLHIHWEQPDSTNRQFTIKYRIQQNGQPKTTDWQTVVSDSNTNSAFEYVSGTINQVTRLADIDLTGVGISSIIQIQLTRTDSNAGDILGTFIDLHCRIDGFGSKGEWSK